MRRSVRQQQRKPVEAIPRVAARVVWLKAGAFQRPLYKKSVFRRVHVVQNDHSVVGGHLLQHRPQAVHSERERAEIVKDEIESPLPPFDEFIPGRQIRRRQVVRCKKAGRFLQPLRGVVHGPDDGLSPGVSSVVPKEKGTEAGAQVQHSLRLRHVAQEEKKNGQLQRGCHDLAGDGADVLSVKGFDAVAEGLFYQAVPLAKPRESRFEASSVDSGRDFLAKAKIVSLVLEVPRIISI